MRSGNYRSGRICPPTRLGITHLWRIGRPAVNRFFGRQEELIRAIQKTGIPVIVVIVNGKPLNNEWTTQHIPGIIDVWEPGMYGGQALAEILFGKVNPSGKLPITIPQHAGQVPIYYYQKDTRYTTGYGLGSSRKMTCQLSVSATD